MGDAPRHWLLFSENFDPDQPIGCHRGALTADAAVQQALPEIEWAEHYAQALRGRVCPICCDIDVRRDP